MIKARPGSAIEWLVPAATGLGGTLTWRVDDGTDTTVDGPHTTGVVELGATGRYIVSVDVPETAGQYVLLASSNGTFTAATVYAEQLEVSFSLDEPASPAGRDLCTLQDVIDMLPGYRQSDTVENKLQEFITSESQLIHREAGREIVALGDQPQQRFFDISGRHARTGRIDVGDLASLEDIEVEVQSADGATTTAVDTDIVIAYYGTKRQPLEEWEPVTRLGIRTGLAQGQVLAVTGTWGFPQIPAFIREAAAKRVILRYVSDVANTDVVDALDNLNLAAMFASARDSIDALNNRVLIA